VLVVSVSALGERLEITGTRVQSSYTLYIEFLTKLRKCYGTPRLQIDPFSYIWAPNSSRVLACSVFCRQPPARQPAYHIKSSLPSTPHAGNSTNPQLQSFGSFKRDHEPINPPSPWHKWPPSHCNSGAKCNSARRWHLQLVVLFPHTFLSHPHKI